MATSYYVKSGSGALEMQNRTWATGSPGDRMVPARSDASANVAVARGWVWECTTGGTSNGTPTWPASVTQDTTTVTQNGVVWTARKCGYSSGTTANWSFATIYLDYIAQANSPLAAGDTVYLSNNDAEAVNAGLTFTFPGSVTNPNKLLSVNDAAAPPTAVSAGASILAKTTNSITVSGSTYCYGVVLTAGETGNFAGDINLGGSSNHVRQVFEQCSFRLGDQSSTTTISLASSSTFDCLMRWINCTVKFSAAGQAIVPCNLSNCITVFEWIGGGGLSGATTPTSILKQGNATSTTVLSCLDLSMYSSSNILDANNRGGAINIRECKLASSWSGSLVVNGAQGTTASLHCCDSSGTNYIVHASRYAGDIYNETTVVRTSPAGASDGTTPLSWKVVSNANTLYPDNVLYSDWFNLGWNDTTGSALTATIEGIIDAVTRPDNSQVWLEIAYLGTSGNPLGVLATSQVADVLTTPTTLASSGSAWVTTGVTNPNPFKMTVSITPQLKGPVIGRVALAKASTTIYIDPPNPRTPVLA